MRARTEEAKDQRRQALLDAALDEFFESGFSGARMSDIAARAGLSKGTLYLYFGSKDDLFVALVDAIAVPKIDEIERVTAAAPSAAGALSGMMRVVPRVVRDSPVPRIIKVLVGDGSRFPQVAQTYRHRIVDRGLALITSILERGQASGEFIVEDARLMARLVIAPVVFSAIWQILFARDPEAHVDLDALFALHERTLLRALAPDSEAKP